MFTIEDISKAHGKVRSGADFPAYIKELKELGVSRYITYVRDGHTLYEGDNAYRQESTAKYPSLQIADNPDHQTFKTKLAEHQQGRSDYIEFCEQSAASGVEKWVVDTAVMTCIYFDLNGNEILKEQIPDQA